MAKVIIEKLRDEALEFEEVLQTGLPRRALSAEEK